MHAYTYARWSTLEQTSGSTLERQLANCSRFIADRGWTPILPPLIDKGVSAYSGKNLADGELGRFTNRVLSGAIEATSSVLVVEELDRLSRQPAAVMISWMTKLLNAGLSIAVTNTGQMITRDMLNRDIGMLLALVVTAFGSYNESAKKADRVSAAWSKKRDDARAGIGAKPNHRAPKWLQHVNGDFVVVPERAAIVRMIFDNRLRGIGKNTTARQLNELRKHDLAFDTWPLGNVKPKLWTSVYVGRILCNRAVLGEWQPYRHGRGEQRRLDGDAAKNFYPAVIDQETFDRANDSRLSHQLRYQGKTKNLSNLLGTKARCARCGGKMDARGSARYRTNRDGSRTRHYFLYCHAAKMDRSCQHTKGWAYDSVEAPLLDTILHLAMDDQFFKNSDDGVAIAERQVITARAALKEIDAKRSRLLTLVEDGDEYAVNTYRRRSEEAVAATAALRTAELQLAAAMGRVTPAEHLRRVSEVRELLTSADDDQRYLARSNVKAAIGALVERIEFDDVQQVASVHLTAGAGLFGIKAGRSGGLINFLKLDRPIWEGHDVETKTTLEGYRRRLEARDKDKD